MSIWYHSRLRSHRPLLDITWRWTRIIRRSSHPLHLNSQYKRISCLSQSSILPQFNFGHLQYHRYKYIVATDLLLIHLDHSWISITSTKVITTTNSLSTVILSTTTTTITSFRDSNMANTPETQVSRQYISCGWNSWRCFAISQSTIAMRDASAVEAEVPVFMWYPYLEGVPTLLKAIRVYVEVKAFSRSPLKLPKIKTTVLQGAKNASEALARVCGSEDLDLVIV